MDTPTQSPVKLQVMICTHRPEGLARVAAMALPAVEGVGYVVSCQSDPVEVPAPLVRDDVAVYFSDTHGLSNNRNAALAHVTAPYALVADDDITLLPDGLRAIIDSLDANPDVDIATFRFTTDAAQKPYPTTPKPQPAAPEPNPAVSKPHPAAPKPHPVAPKPYPAAVHDLSRRCRGYYVSSIEIAMRVASVRSAALSFNPLMGLGAPLLQSGEDELFILCALRRRLSCRFFPIDIAHHPGSTTGTTPYTSTGASTGATTDSPSITTGTSPGVLRAQGAYIALAYPWTAPLRLPLLAHRRPGPLLSNLRHLLRGFLYALRHRPSLLR